MQIVQIVKRFGPVGGMEEYAYQLSIELSKMGHQVVVICEKSYVNPSMDIFVVETGFHRKPNWLAHYRFSRKVTEWLIENDSPHRVVHSHERQLDHNVTTFHTTPFGHGRGPFFRFLSLRNYFYEELERRELLGHQVRAIVPVSNKLGEMISSKHIGAKENLLGAIHPGVAAPKVKPKERVVSADGGTIGFIGKEWERKGLPKVVQVWRDLKKVRPNLKLKVAGPLSEEVNHLFSSNEKNYELLGYVDDKPKFFELIDILVHPAKLEAFGMVITEALSFGVPVLCSSECGAAEVVGLNSGNVLSEECDSEEWASSASYILAQTNNFTFTRSWASCAEEYKKLYELIS